MTPEEAAQHPWLPASTLLQTTASQYELRHSYSDASVNSKSTTLEETYKLYKNSGSMITIGDKTKAKSSVDEDNDENHGENSANSSVDSNLNNTGSSNEKVRWLQDSEI